MRLDGEVALVTGASRGIGAAIAHSLGECGARVIGTSTSEAGARAIGEKLGTFTPPGFGLVLDVADASAIVKLMETLEERSALPSILVNNAGITRDNLLVRMNPEEWDEVIDTNLTGPFRMTRVVARHMMKARHGRIINVASVVGAMGNAGQVNYAAAKAGIMGFTKALARELGGRGITVNAVAPGFIDTDMTRGLSDEQKERLLQQIPLARLGVPQDVAAAVTFLASGGAGYITGTTLHVNGGLHMS